MKYVWYTNPTGFSLWHRNEERKTEEPVYIQQQQAQWITKEVRTNGDFEAEELSHNFLDCLKALRDEISALRDEEDKELSKSHAEARKNLMQLLDYKEKKIVNELLMYYGREDLEPSDEMASLLDYATQKSSIESKTTPGDSGDE